MAYRIRIARQGEGNQIFEAFKKACEPAYVSAYSPEAKEKHIKDFTVFVAEADGMIVGSGMTGINGSFKGVDIHFLGNNFVVKEYQGQGIGRALVEVRAEFIKQRKGIMSTVARAKNPKTQHLLYSVGLKPMGIIPHIQDFGGGMEACIFMSSLDIIPEQIDKGLAKYFNPIKFSPSNRNINKTPQFENLGKEGIFVPFEKAPLDIAGFVPTRVSIEDFQGVFYNPVSNGNGIIYSTDEFILSEDIKKVYGELFYKIYSRLMAED